MRTATASLAIFLLGGAVVGCGRGRGVVTVNVTAKGMVVGIDRLQVTAKVEGSAAQPASLTPEQRPFSIPPTQTLALVFPPERTGKFELQIEALDKAGARLAQGSAGGEIRASANAEVTVELAGTGPLLDLAAVADLAALPDGGDDLGDDGGQGGDGGEGDLGAEDLGADLAGPDLVMGGDLHEADLTMAGDLAMSRDLTVLPTPTLTSIMPTTGPSTGGDTLQLVGTNFVKGCTVQIGPATVTPTLVAANQLTVTSPRVPGLAGSVPVSVINPDGQRATRANLFTYHLGAVGAAQARTTVTAAQPSGLVAADLNGDKIQDLVTADTGAEGISVLLGKGDGTFTRTAFPVPGAPSSVAIADFDRNGIADLAVTQVKLSRVGILKGMGNGVFSPITSYSTDVNPVAITAALVNGDAFLDLVTTNQTANTISVLLGNGDGTFQAPRNASAPGSPLALVAQQFNADPFLDLAVVTNGNASVAVLSGKGDGAFTPPTAYAVGASPLSVRALLLNGDSFQDLVTLNAGGDVAVLFGRGDGTFGTATNFAAGKSPTAMTATNFNLDAFADLVVSNAGANTFSLLLGRGGTFAPAVTFTIPDGPRSVVAADFNGDGRPDVAVSYSGLAGNGVAVALNTSL